MIMCVSEYIQDFVVIFRKGTNNGYEMVASRRIEIVIVRLTENRTTTVGGTKCRRTIRIQI